MAGHNDAQPSSAVTQGRLPVPPETRFTLLGVGAMNSPRYSPAGLLISRDQVRVAIDGGPGAEPNGPLAAWLVTDERAELIRELRRLAAAHSLSPAVRAYHASGLTITPHPVVHTSHPAYGYLIEAGGTRTAWAPGQEVLAERRLAGHGPAQVARHHVQLIQVGQQPPGTTCLPRPRPPATGADELAHGAVLDTRGGRVQKPPGQIRERAGSRDLRPDPSHLPVGRIMPRQAVTGQLVATRHDQANLSPGLAIGLSNATVPPVPQPTW
jgi:hypothetical protein